MSNPTAPDFWQHLVQWQPATAAALAQYLRTLPDDWPLRVFGVGRPDAALTLPPGAAGERFPDRAPEVAPYDEIAEWDDCPACTETAGNCRFHEGYAAGYHQQAEALRDAVKARPDITLREFFLWQADVADAEDRGEEPPMMPAVSSAGQAPATDQTDDDVRDQVLHALDFAYCQGIGYSTPEELLAAYDASRTTAPAGQAEAVLRVVEMALGDTLVASARGEALAGIAGVLHASTPTDQAAVLRRAADTVASHPGPHRDELQPDAPGFWWDTRDRDAAADLLRRMADETPAAETEAEIDLPARLEAALTERYTELGNPFSRMRRQEKGPDGWPAEHPVGPHHVAGVLRELLADNEPAGARQDEPAVPVHAIPLPGSNGISACCGRPPCEFVGEHVTRDPDKVTCTGPAAGARQDGEAP